LYLDSDKSFVSYWKSGYRGEMNILIELFIAGSFMLCLNHGTENRCVSEISIADEALLRTKDNSSSAKAPLLYLDYPNNVVDLCEIPSRKPFTYSIHYKNIGKSYLHIRKVYFKGG